MEKWLGLIVVLGSLVIAVMLAGKFEKRRALRHLRGRESISAAMFATRFFRDRDIDLAEKLVTILARHLAVDLGRLHPDDRLVDDLRMDAMDSLSTAEFVIDIEQTFGINIPDDAARQIFTFRQVVDCVSSRMRWVGNEKLS